MSRKAWIAFAVVQLFGELGPWVGLRMKSSLGPTLWVTGMIIMMPGRLLALFVTEKLLWNTGLTPVMTTILILIIEIPTNLLVWLLCVRCWRSWRHRNAMASTRAPE